MTDNLFTGHIVQLSEQTVELELEQSSGCSTCGIKVLCYPGKKVSRKLILPNPGGLLHGQVVQVEENGRATLKLALFQYGIPLLGFIVGILSVYFTRRGEIQATLGGLIGLGLGAVIAYRLIRRWACQGNPGFFRIKTTA